MNILIKEPKGQWEQIDIPNRLKSLQDLVGGYIETVGFASDATFIVDEEGRLKGKEPNETGLYMNFVGTVLIVGVDGEEFCDVPRWVIEEVGA